MKLSSHHHFLQRIRLIDSMGPHFLYMCGVLMDKFTHIFERIIGKEQVDGIHFIIIREGSTR